MTRTIFFEQVLLILTYAILWCVYVVAIYLYWQAYTVMKRTRIIRALLVFLIGLFLQDIFFGIRILLSETGRASWMFNPIIWLIPKSIVVLSLTYFIWASTVPDEAAKQICTAGNKIGGHEHEN